MSRRHMMILAAFAITAATATLSPAQTTRPADLLQRYKANQLSQAQAQAAITQALTEQANPDQAWDSAWADLIERANGRGDMTRDQDRRYLEQAVAGMYVLAVREKFTHDMQLNYRQIGRGARIGAHA